MNTPNIIQATGRRKNAVATATLTPGTGKIVVNGKELEKFFSGHHRHIFTALKPLKVTNNDKNYDVVVKASGGGISGQAGAIGLSIARALVKLDPALKAPLRKESLLTRDPRMVERKKPGKPKARKRFQFSKR